MGDDVLASPPRGGLARVKIKGCRVREAKIRDHPALNLVRSHQTRPLFFRLDVETSYGFEGLVAASTLRSAHVAFSTSEALISP